MENTIKGIVVRVGDNDICIENVSAVRIGELTLTHDVVSAIGYTPIEALSKDMERLVDFMINLSFVSDLTDMEIMDKIRAIYCVKDLLSDVEKCLPPS